MNSRNDIKTKVIACMQEGAVALPCNIDTRDTFRQLGFDSLDMTELDVELEETFGIEIPSIDEFYDASVDSMIDYIYSYLKNN